MKVSLLFPPTWHPSQPYLSLPSLTGFLHQGGVSDVSQRDLGIELLDTVLTREYAAEVYHQLIAKQRDLERTQTGETGSGSREHYAKVTDSARRLTAPPPRMSRKPRRGPRFWHRPRARCAPPAPRSR